MAQIGRPKGSKNRKTVGMIVAKRNGISPLEFLLAVMDNEDNELNVRIDAAKSACPYLHQRLALLAVEHKGEVQVRRVERSIVSTDSRQVINSDSRSIPTVN